MDILEQDLKGHLIDNGKPVMLIGIIDDLIVLVQKIIVPQRQGKMHGIVRIKRTGHGFCADQFLVLSGDDKVVGIQQQAFS